MLQFAVNVFVCVSDCVSGKGTSGSTAAAREDAAIRNLAGSSGLLSVGNILAVNEAGIADDTVQIKENETHRKLGLDGLLNAHAAHIGFFEGLTLGRTISAPLQSMSTPLHLSTYA